MESFLENHINPPLQILRLPANFDTYLFNQEHIVTQQDSTSYKTFVLLNTKKQKLEAKCIIFIQNKRAYSPLLAPFGGIEFSSKLSLDDLERFIDFVEYFLKNENIESLYLKQYPFCYKQDNNQLLTKTLLDKGYHICSSELNQHLDLSTDSFLENLHLSERRRLQKCKKASLRFEEWQNPDLEFAYSFVSKARLRKDVPVSLSFESFQNLFKTFPQYYKIFVVKDKDQVIALTTLVEINSSIVYYFFPADHEDYLRFSPSVLLIAGLYEYAKRCAYRIFDLGISTVEGKINKGLFDFKKNLGTKVSLKLSFEKKL